MINDFEKAHGQKWLDLIERASRPTMGAGNGNGGERPDDQRVFEFKWIAPFGSPSNDGTDKPRVHTAYAVGADAATVTGNSISASDGAVVACNIIRGGRS